MKLRHPRRLLVAGVVGLAGLMAGSAWAASHAAGSLDPSFGGTGYVTTAFPGGPSFADGVTTDDSKTLVVGGVSQNNGDFALARYKKDGSLDTSFGSGGLVTTDFSGGQDLASAVALQGDKIVVVGYTSPDGGTTFEFALARYLKNGSLDTSFGSGGKVVSNFSGYDFADAVAIDDSRIVVAGESRLGGGGNNFAVARYKKNGSLDSSFGTGGLVTTDFNGGFDSANGVALQDDRIVAAGYVQGTNFDFGLVRYRSNGTLDTSFGTGGKVETDFGSGNDYGHSVDVKGDRIVVVGSASNGTNQDFAAAVYDKKGMPDTRFGGTGRSTIDLGGDDQAYAGGFGDDGTVVAAGDSFNTNDQFAVARWTKKGVADPRFGGGDGFTTTTIGTDSGAFAMAFGPDNKIVAAGYSDDNFAVARYFNGGDD